MTPAQLIARTASSRGYTLADLRRQDRHRPLAWARQDAMRAAHDAGCSKLAIARTLQRDRMTVAHGIQQSHRRQQQEART